jgi:5,10-methylenetetrahydromethanopterin reductase
MRFSLRLNNDLPASTYVELALHAEAAGFDQLWVSHDLFLRHAWVILASVAQATRRISLGTCIVNPYTSHPAEIAMGAATLDELSGGRFRLGIGAGAHTFLEWIGLDQRRPLRAVAETVRTVRTLLAGQVPESTPGATVPGWTREAYLRVPSRPVPMYVGATAPRMRRLIGEVADGGLPLLFPPETYAAVARDVASGARHAGRSLDAIDLAACVWCSVDRDRSAAEAPLRDKIAYYGPALSAASLAELDLGPAEFEPIRRALHVERDPMRARAMVTPAMLRIGIAGTPDDVVERLQGLVRQGARHLSFGPPLGPSPISAVDLLGREVLPRLREQAAGSR